MRFRALSIFTMILFATFSASCNGNKPAERNRQTLSSIPEPEADIRAIESIYEPFLMRIGFIVNDIETENEGYTTTHIAMTAVNQGHGVRVVGAENGQAVHFDLPCDGRGAGAAATGQPGGRPRMV